MANIKSIGGNPIVPEGVENDAITGAMIADDTIPDAKLAQTGGVLSRVADIREDFDALSIDGYEHPWVALPSVITYGKYIQTNGVQVDLASYNFAEVECKPGTTYRITGTKGTGARLYVIQDVNHDYLDAAESATSGLVTVEYTTPVGAKYIYVNCAALAGMPRVAVEDKRSFAPDDDAAVNVIDNGDGTYVINGAQYSTYVNLSGSNNGTFKFVGISYSGGTFKSIGDDVTPLSLGAVGFVGANHGYSFGYECVSTSHGLTEADIGKTSVDGANTWVLLKVPDKDTVLVGCYYETRWFRLVVGTVPATLDFGTSIAVESSTLVQIHPSVKNVNVQVLDTPADRWSVIETYDIIEIGVAIDAMMENVGSNDNDSLVELSDSAITVRNIYEFRANGSITIYQNIKVLKDYITVAYYGGIQSAAFSTTDYFSVPQTDYSAPTATGSTIDFVRSTWDDEAVPPAMFVQYNNAEDNGLTRAMFLGFIGPNRNADVSSQAGSINRNRKMYPYMVQPSAIVGEGKVYSMVSYRIPAMKNDLDDEIPFVAYAYAYDDIYLIVKLLSTAKSKAIVLPNSMWGKRCEVVMSDGIICSTSVVVDSLDIQGTANGTLLVRLYD